MFRKLHTRISPASVLAMVALFVSLGGISYAAATIGSADIKDNSVKSKDIRNKTLVGKDVKVDSLGGDQIDESKLGKVPGATTADSATQAQSAQTAAAVGPNGVDSAALQAASVTGPKLANIALRIQTVSVAAGDTELVTADCLAGERMISGGNIWSGTITAVSAAQLHIVHSFSTGNSWATRGYNGTAAARDLTARVLCLAG